MPTCSRTLIGMTLVVATGISSAQEFAAGFDLVVAQHPTTADPEVVLQVWSWTELECTEGRTLVAAGAFDLLLSHAVIAPGGGQVWTHCKLPVTGWPPPCNVGPAPPQAAGVHVRDFDFAQTPGGSLGGREIVYDHPLHVMDIHMIVEDLTPRDVRVETTSRGHLSGCVVDDYAHVFFEESPIEGQTIIRVNGGCPADFDGDGDLTIFDFLAYQNAFAAGDLSADLDGDGVLTFFDFLAFQNEFDAGCA